MMVELPLLLAELQLASVQVNYGNVVIIISTIVVVSLLTNWAERLLHSLSPIYQKFSPKQKLIASSKYYAHCYVIIVLVYAWP